MKAKVLVSLLVCALAATAVSAATEQSPTFPVQGKVAYSFMSDYFWHGMDMTKFLGGHTGKGAHEATYGLGVDLKDLSPDYYGIVWVTFDQVYFRDYELTNGNLAKNDMAVSYMLQNVLDGDLTFGYRNYRWENVNRFAGQTQSQELSIKYAYNDGSLWKELTGSDWGKRVLNPSLEYIFDYDMADNGSLLVGSLSHDFQLEEMSPELTGLSLTPGIKAVYDFEYYGSYISSLTGGAFTDHNKLGYLDYTLNLGADISKMTGAKWGKITANAGIGFVNAHEHVTTDLLKDQLYSYFNVGFAW